MKKYLKATAFMAFLVLLWLTCTLACAGSISGLISFVRSITWEGTKIAIAASFTVGVFGALYKPLRDWASQQWDDSGQSITSGDTNPGWD